LPDDPGAPRPRRQRQVENAQFSGGADSQRVPDVRTESTYRVPVVGTYANDFAVPLRPDTTLPVRLTSISVSLPSSPTLKLEMELSPPLVANRKRLSAVTITLPAASKAFGALSWPLIGL
jgi:hypothetical protein